MAYLTLIGLLVAAGLVFYGLMVWAFARTLLMPPRMTDGKALAVLGRMGPGDVGLAEADWSVVEMVVRTIGKEEVFKSWWVPAAAKSARADTTVLLLHGFADSKIGALAWLPVLRDLGVNVLMVDLRAHGEAPGPWSTAGELERRDLLEIARQAKVRWPEQARRIVILGPSLAALCAAAAVALDRVEAAEGGQGDVKGVFDGLILDSPVASYSQAMAAHARMMNLPGKWVQWGAIRIAAWWTGADYEALSLASSLRAAKGVPTLLIAPAGDPYLDGHPKRPLPGLVSEFPAVRVWQPECGHLMAVSAEAGKYAEEVGRLW